MNVLTFDIEDWFHILDNDSTKSEREWTRYEDRLRLAVDRIFELLERTQQSATFFCLGWCAQKHPDIIKQIDSYGFEVGTHSNLHQLVYQQDRKSFNADLEASIKLLEDTTGKKVISYRAPGFSIDESNQWAFEALIKHGIQRDCSVFPAKRAHGGFENFGNGEPSIIQINGMRLKEFPINLYSFGMKRLVFSGGGYFRIMPYPAIKYFMKRSDYVMTYFHPRDFDSEQPRIKGLSALRRFKSYYGIKNAFQKLEHLIHDFRFVDLHEADLMTSWDNMRVVEF